MFRDQASIPDVITIRKDLLTSQNSVTNQISCDPTFNSSSIDTSAFAQHPGQDTNFFKFECFPEKAKFTYSTSILPKDDLHEILTTCREIITKYGGQLRFAAINCAFSELLMPIVSEKVASNSDIRKSLPVRLAHTRNFIIAMAYYGPDSEIGERTLDSVNLKHSRLGVSSDNPDFRYVIYTLTKKLITSLRERTGNEITTFQEESWFKLWKDVAGRMGCNDISDYQTFVAEQADFEKAALEKVTATSRRLACHLLESITKTSPFIFRGLSEKLILGMIDQPVAKALELPVLSRFSHFMCESILNAVGGMRTFCKNLGGSLIPSEAELLDRLQ